MEGGNEKASTENLSHTEHKENLVAEPQRTAKATPRRITRLSKQARENTASEWKNARESFLKRF